MLKNSVIYTFVTFLQRAAGFLLLPFYTHYLNPNDYGNLSVVMSVSNFISILFLLAIPYATARFNYNSTSIDYKKILWGNNLILILLSSIVFGTLIIIFHKYTVDYLSKGISFFPLMLISVLTIITNSAYIHYQSYLQTTQQAKNYGLNLTMNFIINNVLTLLFVINLKLGIIGILLANFITAILFSIYTVKKFIPEIKISFNKEISKQTFSYSLPLIPHTLFFWIINMLDRVFLANTNSFSEAGIYSVGNQIGSTINVMTSSVNQAYSPWFYNLLKNDSGIDIVVEAVNKLSILYCVVALALSLFSKELILLLTTKEYAEAWKVIPIIAFGCVFFGYYHFFANIILLEQKTSYFIIISGFSAFISIAMNLLLIPEINTQGAAISIMVAHFTTCTITCFISKKIRPDINLNIKKMYSNLTIFFLVSLITYIDTYVEYHLYILMKIIACLLTLLLIFIKYKNTFQIMTKKRIT